MIIQSSFILLYLNNALRELDLEGLAGAEANAYIPLLIYSAVPIPTPIPTPILIYTLAPPLQHVKTTIGHDPLN